MAALATAGLAGLQQILAPSIEGADSSVSAPSVDDGLRVLALLNPLLRALIDAVATEVGTSPVRATLLALLTEDLSRTTGRAQIVAAGKVAESDAHTLCEEPLAAIHELHSHVEDFAVGTACLPPEDCHRPGSKMLFKDATDFLKDRLHLSYVQAKHRLITRDLLLPHAGFNNATIAPRFGELANVFSDGRADPQRVADAARRLVALQPGIDAQEDSAAAAARIEQQLAETLVSRNQTGTGALLKHVSAELDAAALERSEAQIEANFGMRFKGKQARGFIWEVCTGVQGHEMLSTFSDRLANPRSAAGRGTRAPEQPELPGLSNGPLSPDPNPIPSWAVDPEMPADQRPLAGFTDLGQPVGLEGPELGVQLLPGESLAAARERIKAGKLLQALLDVMRLATNPDQGTGTGLPLKPQVEMIVTISWDSLVGKLNDPGVTTHGHLVSAGHARRLACVANIIPAVLGTESQPLDLGRTQRFFNRAQRRAMALRDRGCINPGCTMAAHRCEANHINPWYLGGKTNLANGALLCPACHASFHAGHFKIIVVNSIPYVLKSKALDPEQKLRRNWNFHPESAAVA